MVRDHLLNRLRNALFFGVRYPWVKHGRNVHVQWSTTMWSPHRHIVIGDEVGIGPWCAFQTDVEIGNKVLIASRVAFVGSDDHRFDLVGTAIWDSPRGDAKKVVVEDDVWIGYGAILLSGARVGRGSIVGAGAVVVGAVEPYSIVVPQKAHTLRKRFSEDEQRTHERSTAKSGPRK
jgi:acetyltransferase-like isoleucine patch superfamily enzyme